MNSRTRIMSKGHHYLAALNSAHGAQFSQNRKPEGTIQEFQTFCTWFFDLPHKYKILIIGNHDKRRTDKSILSPNVWYLDDEVIMIEWIEIYGTHFSPDHNQLSDERLENWSKIPAKVDSMVTLCPRFGLLDLKVKDQNAWCPDCGPNTVSISFIRPHPRIDWRCKEGWKDIHQWISRQSK